MTALAPGLRSPARRRLLQQVALGGLLAVAAAGPRRARAAAPSPLGTASTQWNALLTRHVRWSAEGHASRVDYAGFAAERGALQAVLQAFSALTPADFERLPRAAQMAFLINAYNAFTVELVLTRWPELRSIKDIGTLFTSPWRQPFFRLLGAPRTLDWIEHERLRPVYRDPRVHAALNCASIGCPALRPEAFDAPMLDAQLDDGLRRFLADRSRNRVDDTAAGGRLVVSPIFKWYREDFERGDRGWQRLEDLFADYADTLSAEPALRVRLRARSVPISFGEYDWSLNAAGR